MSKNTPAFRLKREWQPVWDNMRTTGKEGHADQTFSLIYQRESKQEPRYETLSVIMAYFQDILRPVPGQEQQTLSATRCMRASLGSRKTSQFTLG